MLYGLAGGNIKYEGAAGEVHKATTLFKAKDYVKAGEAFLKAWTLTKPTVPQALWSAGLAYEQATADQTASLTARKANAFKAKALFIEWQALKLPSAAKNKVAARIMALTTFITKINDAIAQGKKVDPDDDDDDDKNKPKKAGIPMAFVIIALVGAIGLVSTMGKKKGKKAA